MNDIKPDMSCVPYRRKGFYLALTIPFLVLLVAVFVYLWGYSSIFALVFALFFLGMNIFQAYCCAYQQCPYVGGFCPAVIGIMPASLLAKLLYGRGMVRSQRRFDTSATLGVTCWMGLIVFPLYWIAQMGIVYALGYAGAHVAYTLLFGYVICPACAIRDICPGGRLSGAVLKRLGK